MKFYYDKFKFYKDAIGEWRYTRTAANGQVVGASHEGFKNKDDCIYNAKINGFDIESHKWEVELEDVI